MILTLKLFFNRLLNPVFKHSRSVFNVESVENPVDKRFSDINFKLSFWEKYFHSFLCEYFPQQLYTNSYSSLLLIYLPLLQNVQSAFCRLLRSRKSALRICRGSINRALSAILPPAAIDGSSQNVRRHFETAHSIKI